jgi:hypothetical protein
MLVKNVATSFAFSIAPDEDDWSWIPDCPDLTSNDRGSQLMIGAYDATPFVNLDNPKPLKVTTSSGSGNWTFELSQFAFGYTKPNDEDVEVSSYVNLTTPNYSSAWMSLGHPGIGLPEPVFEAFVDVLQSVTGNIWVCNEKYGYFCYAPVVCETFIGEPGSSYDLTNYDFRITFGSDEGNYIRLPILSMMRNAQDNNSQCNMLVYFLDPEKWMGDNIVLGSAFFQNFFAEFEYNVDNNLNTMQLTLA